MLVVSRGPGMGVTIGDDIRVIVRSVPNRNRVKLGIDAPADVTVLRDELAPSTAEPEGGVFRVIVVEDNPIHARMIVAGLNNAGVTNVRIVTSGRGALRHLILEPARWPTRPDLIVLDLQLPDRSGIDVLERVRAHEPLRRVPVVVLSCSDAASNVERCLDAGANAFMVKEEDGDRFRQEVSRIASFWRRTKRVA